MIEFHVYPGGKKRICTFSYDDGAPSDERLIAVMDKYDVKSAFHLCGSNYIGIDRTKQKRLQRLYANHEVSCHTFSHGWPARMPLPSVLEEVWKDRKTLENVFEQPVVGMSYPSGSYSEQVKDVLRSCGIVYSRTVKATKNFMFPDDFLAWHPTCHHRDAEECVDRFLENLDSPWTYTMLYIWGHSHEFRTEDDWAYIEAIIKKIAHNDKIWYATNIEIYDYVSCQRQLRISADETVFYNPTATDIYIEKNKSKILCIPAGKTITDK